jgi:F-type H+-transporting ATPase subunit b
MARTILTTTLVLIGPALPALAAGTEKADKKASAFPAFDSSTYASQIFWLAITFGALYYLMSKVALPRVASIIEERETTIDKALASAAAAQKSAEGEAAAMETALAKAKAAAQAEVASARAKSAKEIDATRASVEKDLAAKLIVAEKRIAETKASAMANVGSIASDAVGAIVERLSGKGPAADAVAKAIASAQK